MLNVVKSALCGRVGSPAAKKRFFGFMAVCLLLGTAFCFAEMQSPPDEMPGHQDEMQCSPGGMSGQQDGMQCPPDGMQQHQGRMRNMMGMKYEKDDVEKALGKIKMYLKLKEELELTDEQQKSLEQIKSDYLKDSIKRDAEIKIIGVDLAENLDKDVSDFEAARSNIKKISAIQLDSKLAAIDVNEKAHKVLTEKQKEKLLQIKKERKEKWAKEKKEKGKEKGKEKK